MAIEYKEHRFSAYGREEMACRACGYVTWPIKSAREVAEAMIELSGRTVWCGGGHHRWFENDGTFTTCLGYEESNEVLPVKDEDLTPPDHPSEHIRRLRARNGV